MKYTELNYEKACEVMKRNPQDMPEVSKLPPKEGEGIIAGHKLKVIADAINHLTKFKPNPKSTTKKQWYPLFDRTRGFAFSVSSYGRWISDSSVGSRHCFRFKDEESSDFFGKEFNDLHIQVLTS